MKFARAQKQHIATLCRYITAFAIIVPLILKVVGHDIKTSQIIGSLVVAVIALFVGLYVLRD